MLLCVCITGEPLKRKGKWTESKTRRTYIVDQHTATEWKDRAPCKCCEFAWCVLLPAAALLMTQRQREKQKVSGQCLSRWALATSVLCSCRPATAAYLYAAAASSGCSARCHILTCVWKLPWLVWLDILKSSKLINWQSYHTWRLCLIVKADRCEKDTQQGDLFVTNQKQMYVLLS